MEEVRTLRIRVSLLCSEEYALLGFCHYELLCLKLVLCQEPSFVEPSTDASSRGDVSLGSLSRRRQGNDSSLSFLLPSAVDFPSFLRASPD